MTQQQAMHTGTYTGRDVIIDFDAQRIRVRRVEGGWFKKRSEEWVDIGDAFSLNSFYAQSIDTRLGRFFFRDLPLTNADLSHGFGKPRLDGERAAALLAAPDALKGANVAFDFAARELAFTPPDLVFPFSSIAGIIDGSPPQLQERRPKMGSGRWPLQGLPISLRELAERLGVPLR